MSSASSNNSKRVRQAMASSTAPESSSRVAPTDLPQSTAPDTVPEETSNATEMTENRSTSRSSLALQRYRSHSMDNRPVDPSPIQVSHTVAMGGQRPIGTSDYQRGPDFSRSQTILNRPIAPNTTAQDDEMLGYLD